MKQLIIAEKKNMGEEIAKALAEKMGLSVSNQRTHCKVGPNIDVTWAIGHIIALKDPEDYNPEWKSWKLEDLPLIPEKWEFKKIQSKKQQLDAIAALLKGTDEVIHAGDPGREGQLIVDEVLVFLKNRKPVKRILLNSLDKDTIFDAYKNMKDNSAFFSLFLSGKARAQADWLIGMNLTRKHSIEEQKRGFRGVFSVGRVQTPTLALVVKSDMERENFVPEDYFVPVMDAEKNGIKFKARWKKSDNEGSFGLDDRRIILDPKIVDSIIKESSQGNVTVSRYEASEQSKEAPLLYNLSELQIYCNRKFGFTAKDTLDICQSLYIKKIASYPRTDYKHLPEKLHDFAPEMIKSIKETIPELAGLETDHRVKHAAWNDSKIGDHYGLIPNLKTKYDISSLSKEERVVFEILCRKYLAIFMKPAVFDKASAEFKAGGHYYTATGSVEKQKGWGAAFDAQDKEKSDAEISLPSFVQGENVSPVKFTSQVSKTTVPPPMTEARLLTQMTNIHTLVSDPVWKKKLQSVKGIGTQATRASIIENLLSKNMITREGKTLVSSKQGRMLLARVNKKLSNPVSTALLEDRLDRIEEKKTIKEANETYDEFMKIQEDFIRSLIG